MKIKDNLRKQLGELKNSYRDLSRENLRTQNSPQKNLSLERTQIEDFDKKYEKRVIESVLEKYELENQELRRTI